MATTAPGLEARRCTGISSVGGGAAHPADAAKGSAGGPIRSTNGTATEACVSAVAPDRADGSRGQSAGLSNTNRMPSRAKAAVVSRGLRG
jgi:hypothetical protein